MRKEVSSLGSSEGTRDGDNDVTDDCEGHGNSNWFDEEIKLV